MAQSDTGHSQLTDAILQLCNIGLSNLQAASRHRPFMDLIDLCVALFPGKVGQTSAGAPDSDNLRWALLHLFDATGVPKDRAASERVAHEIQTTMAMAGGDVLHLCPLDKADELPAMRFGPCEVRRFSRAELAEAMQFQRLRNRFPSLNIDLGAFARFDWLVVRETVSFGTTIKDRASPFRFLDLNQDFGSIKPFARAWPEIVSKAAFALLLLPWEDMVVYPDVDWRAFRIPWVYSVKPDIFDAPAYPRGPDSLSWEPDFYHDEATGEEIETERPFRLPIKDELEAFFAPLNDVRWLAIGKAQASPIFNPLTTHFMIRAFATDEIDEFLSHVTTIEAALGMGSDHGIGRPRPRIGRSNVGATERVARRVAALTGEASAAATYRSLFDVRSMFIHGRQMGDISSATRLQARSLARTVVDGLLAATITSAAPDRDTYLSSLCP